MSTSLANIANPTRTGHIRLQPYGRELFGTVIRTGKMQKTCTIRMSRYSWNYRMKIWNNCSRNFHAHDEEEFCQTGDKVIVRFGRSFSKTKKYYVRNVILPVGR